MTIMVDEDGDCMMGTLLPPPPDWDYAEDWSVHPLRELHPFVPLRYGKEITQEEFLRMVKAIHGLAL
jgi:hypothetical protein